MLSPWPMWWGIAFLSGSIPFGVILAKLHGIDLRSVGSGNVGATNVGRALGRRWGIFCFVLDALKGSVPVLLAGTFTGALGTPIVHMTSAMTWGWTCMVAAAVLGHVFCPWIGFNGGKGVATGFGCMIAMWPVLTWAALLALLTWIVSMKLTRIVSLSSLISAALMPVWCAVTLPWPVNGEPGTPLRPMALTGLIALAVMLAHRANISRLVAGTEPCVGKKKTTNPDSIGS